MNDELVMIVLKRSREIVIGKNKTNYKDRNNVVNISQPISIVLRPTSTPQGTQYSLEPQNFPIPFASLLLIEDYKNANIKMDDIIQVYSEEELKKELIDWYFKVVSDIEVTNRMPTSSSLIN